MVNVDWTINLSHVLELGVAVATLIGLYFAIKYDMKLFAYQLQQLGGRMINVENGIKELTAVAVSLAESNLRMQSFDIRMVELSRRLNSIDEHGSRQFQAMVDRVKRVEDLVYREKND